MKITIVLSALELIGGVNEKKVENAISDNSKIEYFDNNGTGGKNSYGIRTGIGSSRIKCIISNGKHIDRMELEIAKNGFYIPVVNINGEILYTPEQYEQMREKMQGLSFYGLTEFKLDETAKSEEVEQIAEIIEKNKEDASRKRGKILNTLEKAIENQDLIMIDKRIYDLTSGIVEVIDTGPTGRGTNAPGDGDFDFMVRLDKEIIQNPEQLEKLKIEIRKALSEQAEPKDNMEINGGFRYKGCTIGDEELDIDLSFIKRTDEIEYSTDESIKDRLETMKNNNSENYKYVIANILLAKQELKRIGAYKKKNAPEPEQGQRDIRGGLGTIGIENWILQNGGSFEKASREFVKVAETCETLEEFQKKYTIWDFGQNYVVGEKYAYTQDKFIYNEYMHDNFVDNMNEDGFIKMKEGLKLYIQEKEANRDNKKKIGEIVAEDISAISDSTYMESVNTILEQARQIGEREER